MIADMLLLTGPLPVLAIVTAGMLMSFMLRRQSPASRHAMWTVVAVCSLLWPLWRVAAPEWSIPLPAKTFSAASSPGNHTPASASTPVSSNSAQQSIVPTQKTSGLAAPEWWVNWARSQSVQSIMAWLWLIGAGYFMVRLARGYQTSYRRTNTARAIDDSGWQLAKAEVAQSEPSILRTALLSSRRTSVPFAWGFGNWRIVLPNNTSDWSHAERVAALTHELGHLKRRDHLSQLAIQLLTVVHWYNPLVWSVRHRMLVDRESACDEMVLSGGTNPSDYATLLVRLIAGPDRQSTVPALKSSSVIEQRVRAILQPISARWVPGPKSIAGFATIGVCFVLSLAGFTPLPPVQGSLHQNFAPLPADGCPPFLGRPDLVRHCSVREFTLAAGPLEISGVHNGSVDVIGWDGTEIGVRVLVDAQAPDSTRAMELAKRIEIPHSSKLTPTGLPQSRDEWVGLHLQLLVPQKSSLTVVTGNADIAITGVEGSLSVNSTNGKVTLRELGGKVNSTTINGDQFVEVSNKEWLGSSLELSSVSGSSFFSLPNHFDGQVVASTLRGEFILDGVTGTPANCGASCLGQQLMIDFGNGLSRLLSTSVHGNQSITVRKAGGLQ